ncbi:erg24, C-14 sterol reductase [Pseudocyphellaria aurata]|nr:erg24, C-14 sterol reductase [Pseudocyphellaria aurata]
MSKSERKSVVSSPGYEFCGPPGALAALLVLPLLCYLAAFLCNDVSGCPVPSTLHPKSLTLAKLKEETGWPTDGIRGLGSWKVTGILLAYYVFSLVLQTVLPGEEIQGVRLRSGGRLNYKFNAFNSAVAVLLMALIGTVLQGPEFALWTFIYDNYIQLLTASIGTSFVLSTYVYVRSFSVQAGNADMRELAAGGHTGSMIYDFFIGRELNPRVDLPLFGTLDIKAFCELRPGMLGWVLLDLAFVAHQYKINGYVSDSIVLITVFQSIYVLDALYMEPAILTTMDITTDGFGFMLAFGDLVWLPFTYSLQARYLAVHPVNLGLRGTLGVLAVQCLGYYIFRSANNEKNRFRNDPNDPKIAHLKHMNTASGSKLLISGWWGTARHINYLGDWIMSWSYCLPTGVAGYVIQHPSPLSSETEAVPGEARGWGMIVTYFYIVYFAILLIHRASRDEHKCMQKYGRDWVEYKKKVPSALLPGIY